MIGPSRAPDDRGVSSLLGFIVGLALLTGSLATVVYFMSTAPESGTSQETQELESSTLRVINTLARTAGEPADWHTLRPVNGTNLTSVGLLEQGSDIGSMTKVGYLQNGTIDAERLAESYNLKAAGYRVDAEGKVVPVPVLRPPSSKVYAVGAASSVVDATDTPDGPEPTGINVQLTSDTQRGIALFEEVNPHFQSTVHRWTPDADGLGNDEWDAHPDGLVGNTHPDEPWFFETQMIPQMAGIQGTFTASDLDGTETLAEAAADAVAAYHDGNQSFPRWHVVTDGEPYGIPNLDASNEDNVLTVNYRATQGSSQNSSGVGHWRTTDGFQSWALLGGWDVTGADTATLSFDQILRTDIAQEDEDETYGPECHEDWNGSTCVRVRPSIAFWNTTGTDQWTRLNETSHTGGCGASGWDDNGSAEASTKWVRKSVDLCEALEHSSGKLWLSFWWKVDCIDIVSGEPVETECGFFKKMPRGWFVDNVQVTADGATVFETGFEPMESGGREALFISNHVDADNYRKVHDDVEEHAYAYLRHFVENDGNVIAFTPNSTGDWFGQLGLASVPRPGSNTTRTNVSNNLVMRMPNELPTKDEAYEAPSHGWNITAAPPNPAGGSPPTGYRALDAVQETVDPKMGTLVHGTPYEEGGHVAAVAYNLTTFNDTKLLLELLENLYVASIFDDPTFDVTGEEPPESGTRPVQALRRVILVHVTEDKQYQVPVEVTLYMWPTQYS